MKKLLFIFCTLLYSWCLMAQLPSMLELEVQTIIAKNGRLLGTTTQRTTCFVEKNETIEAIDWKDTISWTIRHQNKTPRQVFDFCQKTNIVFDLKKNKLHLKVKPYFSLWLLRPALSSNYKELLREQDFHNTISLNFKNNASQNIDYQIDSFSIKHKITLRFPFCLSEKWSNQNGGLVTVYYRAAREHLNKNNPSASSTGRAMDWGHAFIGVKDLKTNRLYFLDGWPDGKLEEGKQHFVWNERVDGQRSADHHAITFGISNKGVRDLIALIESYRTACIAYELIDFNCTDATTKALEKIGYYTAKDKSGTVLPNSFANHLMEKLNEQKVCFEFDGYRIK